MARQAFAVNHGITEEHLVVGVYDRDTNELLVTYKINGAMKVSKIRDYVTEKSLELDFNVLEWR